MNINAFIRILWARWFIIAGITGAAILAAIAINLVTPRSYTATTELIVDGKAQDPISGQLMPARLLTGYIATQADIIRSRNVANKVINLLKLTEPSLAPSGLKKEFDKLSAGEAPSRQALLAYLNDRLTVAPKRDSSVLSIAFNAQDPELAALIADSFAQAYIQTNLELRIEPAKQITSWYDQQLATLRTNLIERQDTLSAYQEEHNILASTDRLDLENAKLAELSSMLVAAQGERLTNQSRTNQVADNKGRALPAQVMENPQIQKLSSDLALARTRLAEQATQVGENHPQYRQTLGEVTGLEHQLNKAIRSVSDSLRSSMELSKSREEQLEAELAAQKDRVLQIGRNRNQLTLLKQEVDNAQSAYDAALARASQTQLESQIASTDVAVLNTAAVPTKPTAPKPTMTLLLAAVGGALFGIALALCLEWLDRRVRSNDDIEQSLGLPVLAYLPPAKVAAAKRKTPVLSNRKATFGSEVAV